MITQFKKKCPVCGDEIVYTDTRNVPETCYKKMCQVNYHAYKNRANTYGVKPDLEEMGVWQPSKDFKKSEKSPAKK
jgi:hypothetical protein